jgi:pimeloyl-ACP methyl ester carboxylesterase
MAEQMARVSPEIELCYETFGDPADEPVLLVMGLATQMIAWREDFCDELAGRGFHVIRFDNRDCGRSTQLTDRRPPTLGQTLRRKRSAAAYSLADMAGDAVGLLDHLGIERAHIVGASMGGMIAQTIAIRFPERVRSLVSIMSNTGDRLTGQPAFKVYPVFLKQAPKDRESFIEHTLTLYKAIGSPGFERNEDDMREMFGREYDRGVSAAANGRQLMAILADRDRAAQLRRLDVPALVIHGTADKLVAKSGGRRTAKAIPGARLLEIDGMGHDLPRGAWPPIIDGIADTAARARQTAAPTAGAEAA